MPASSGEISPLLLLHRIDIGLPPVRRSLPSGFPRLQLHPACPQLWYPPFPSMHLPPGSSPPHLFPCYYYYYYCHSGLILPLQALQAAAPPLKTRFPYPQLQHVHAFVLSHPHSLTCVLTFNVACVIAMLVVIKDHSVTGFLDSVHAK